MAIIGVALNDGARIDGIAFPMSCVAALSSDEIDQGVLWGFEYLRALFWMELVATAEEAVGSMDDYGHA